MYFRKNLCCVPETKKNKESLSKEVNKMKKSYSIFRNDI